MNESNVTEVINKGMIIINSIEVSLSFAPLMIARLVLLVVVIIWRDQQPLKARGFLPIIQLLCQIMNVILIETGYWTNLPLLPPNIYPSVTVGVQPYVGCFSVTIVFALCFQVVRFNLIKNFNRLKLFKWRESMDLEEMEVTNTSNYRLYKIATSDVTLIVCMVIVLLSALILGSVATALIQKGILTHLTGLLIVSGMMLTFSLLFIIIAFCFMIWGLLRESQHEGLTGWLSVVRDPLLFHFDVLVLLVLCIPVTVTIISMIFSTLPTVTASPEKYFIVIAMLRISLCVGSWILISVSGLTCVIAIIKRRLTKVDEVIANNDSCSQLQAVLNAHGERRRLFEAFCKGEYCSENIQAYTEIERYRNLTDKATALKLACHIVNTYLTVGSISEVNVPEQFKKSLTQAVEQEFSDNASWKDLMNDLAQELIQNMNDPFGRFIRSPVYRRLSIQLDLKAAELRDKNYAL